MANKNVPAQSVFSPKHAEQLNLLQSLFEAMMEVEHEFDRHALATIGWGLANQWRTGLPDAA